MSANDPNNQLIIPTGEAAVGRVDDKQATPSPAPQRRLASDDSPQPVLERPVPGLPNSEPMPASAPRAEKVAPEISATPNAVPQPSEPLQAEPVVSEPVAIAPQVIARPPLQESVQVSIPERMNQLHSENKRLRSEMEALERALQKPMS